MQRYAAPTTGNQNVDTAFNMLAMAIANGHNAAAFQRGWDAYLAKQSIPLAETEAEGYVSAVHGLGWETTMPEPVKAPNDSSAVA